MNVNINTNSSASVNINGIDKIKERILEDAKLEAKKIIEDANIKIDEVKKNSEAKAATIKEKLNKDYEVKKSDLKRRMLSVAQLDMRKDTLQAKQSMIDKVFAQCLKTVSEMPAAEYRAIIEDLLLQTIQTGNEEIIFSKLDDARLDSNFIAGVNSRLTSMGKKGEVKVAQEKGTFNGGFILRAGGVEINSTFEAILRLAREEIESQVAQMLFV